MTPKRGKRGTCGPGGAPVGPPGPFPGPLPVPSRVEEVIRDSNRWKPTSVRERLLDEDFKPPYPGHPGDKKRHVRRS